MYMYIDIHTYIHIHTEIYIYKYAYKASGIQTFLNNPKHVVTASLSSITYDKAQSYQLLLVLPALDTQPQELFVDQKRPSKTLKPQP